MGTPHKHAEAIKAWAEGEIIEVLTNDCGPDGEEGNSWKPCPNPLWHTHTKYRVKHMPHKWQKEMDAAKARKVIQYRYLSDPVNANRWVDWAGACAFVEDPSVWDQDCYEFRIKPESVVRWMEVNEHGSVLMGAPLRGANLKLTFEDGKLVKAEVL